LSFLLFAEHVSYNVGLAYVFWIAAYGLLCVSVSALICGRCAGVRLAVAAAVALFALYFVDPERILPVLAVAAVFLSYPFPSARNRVFVVGGIVAAFGMYMKLTIGFTTFTALAGSALFPFETRATARRLGLLAGSFCASLIVFWFLMNLSLAGMIDYFRMSFELVKGYSSLGRAVPYEKRCIAAFVAAIALLYGLVARLPKGERLHAGAVMVGPLFDSWKHALGRLDDGHIVHLFATLAYLTMFVYILHERERKRTWPEFWRPAAAAAIVLLSNLGMWIVSDVKIPFSRAIPHSAQWLHITDGFSCLKNVFGWKAYEASLDAVGAENLHSYRLSEPFVSMIGSGQFTSGGTLCVYSYDLGAVGFNPVVYKQPPVPQYFNAFTHNLDMRHAAFFDAPTRPDFMLMYNENEMYGIDGRHLLFDDPYAQLAILNHYRVVRIERTPGYRPAALLADVGKARFGEPVSLGKAQATWHEKVNVPTVPATSILRVRVRAGVSVLRSLKRALLHLTPMHIHYTLSDGTEYEYALVSTHMEDGVWVQPLLPTRDAYYNFLARKPMLNPNVASIRFEADNPRDYEPTLELEWERIDALEPQAEGAKAFGN
jgi:hypothetical protein